VHQAAQAIDREKKSVRLADGSQVSYDRLVVALGIDLKFDSVPGYSDDAPQQQTKRHAEKAPAAATSGERPERYADALRYSLADRRRYNAPHHRRVSFPIDRWRRFSTAWDSAETSQAAVLMTPLAGSRGRRVIKGKSAVAAFAGASHRSHGHLDVEE
jgi:hypothetical protein